jgi:hypothetical protein
MEKILIKSVQEYIFFKMTCSEESFKRRFIISNDIATKVLTEEVLRNLIKDSRQLTSSEANRIKLGTF